MDNKNTNFENEYDSYKDVVEFQNNMYNPGHYIGTGRVSPLASATGNPTPLVPFCFLSAVALVAFGLFLFFSDVNVTGLDIISPLGNKIIALVIMLCLAAFFTVFGFAYLKKAKKYYEAKRAMQNEPIDETVEDKLWQRTCPNCNKSHDIDYPKCPYCRYDYNPDDEF